MVFDNTPPNTCGCLSRNLKIDLPPVGGEPVPMLYEVSHVLEMLQQFLEGCKILKLMDRDYLF